jgi:hypothetical protein
METPSSSETSVLTSATRRNIPEDAIRHSSRSDSRHNATGALLFALTPPEGKENFTSRYYVLLVLCGTQRFITAFTTARHCTGLSFEPDESAPYIHVLALKSV